MKTIVSGVVTLKWINVKVVSLDIFPIVLWGLYFGITVCYQHKHKKCYINGDVLSGLYLNTQ